MKFYKLGGSGWGQTIVGEEQGDAWNRHADSTSSALAHRAIPCHAMLRRGSHALEQIPDHFIHCRSQGVGFHECSGAGLSGQAKLLVGCRQKATEQV